MSSSNCMITASMLAQSACAILLFVLIPLLRSSNACIWRLADLQLSGRVCEGGRGRVRGRTPLTCLMGLSRLTCLTPWTRGTRMAGSTAWAASSMTTTSNLRAIWEKMLEPEKDSVEHTMWASSSSFSFILSRSIRLGCRPTCQANVCSNLFFVHQIEFGSKERMNLWL